jgi:hypothetical protein
MPSGTLLLIVAFTSLFSAPYEAADSVSANQIRSQRQEIDKAFQHHDAKQLATLFSSACHFTTAAVHIDGGDALEHFHEALFLKRPDVTLVHQTDRIVVNENWDVAVRTRRMDRTLDRKRRHNRIARFLLGPVEKGERPVAGRR